MASEPIYKVFVSSTFQDLREERAEVQKALLKLNCFPVVMELFPAADDETWDFIKDQINDADYYVVLVAGRYGSLAPDGISFTEKEYDYARERKIPSIGFVHADRAKIPSGQTDSDPKIVEKLDAFIRKLKQHPVREFQNSHQLALEVTTSFVDLKRTKPRIGFVRKNETVDYRKYAEILEKNTELEKQLNAVHQKLTPKMRAIFDPNKSPCRSVSEFRFRDRTPKNGMVYRTEVENIGAETIHDCEGYLTEVYFETEAVELGAFNLLWSGMYPQALRVDLKPNVKRHLDLIVIYEDGQVIIISPGWPPNNQQNFFSRHGNYLFTVVISGENSTLPPHKLRLNYTGDWQTSTMEQM